MATLSDVGDFVSLGIVTTASTSVGVRVTTNLADPVAALPCQAISFQALSTGTGVVYICNTANPVLTDGLQKGIIWEIPPPSAAPVTRPLLAIGNPTGTAPLNVAELFVLPVVGGEGVRITVML